MKPGKLILPNIHKGNTWGPFLLAKMNYLDGTEIEISSATMEIRATNASKALIFSATTADGSLVLSTVGTLLNIVSLQMVSDAFTDTLTVGSYSWELTVRLPGGQVWTILEGPVVVYD